ncbi:GYF domain [Musa troglodytarum]|uniref:GYF domain n=1 Tax=Musa troglodytarum TaxID=320322 RepID=A0A9E7EFI3_9LILI|nr:GYF domain [Musa troglodytarum]
MGAELEQAKSCLNLAQLKRKTSDLIKIKVVQIPRWSLVDFGDISKGEDNSFLADTCDPHSTSSAAGSDLASKQSAKAKNPTNGSSEGGCLNYGGNSTSHVSETSISNKKDFRFRRTTSSSDADVAEPSFSDMLKSTKKTMPDPESVEVVSIGKSAKKKGKKGRQIDPSLLGFKVHSNRILMGG